MKECFHFTKNKYLNDIVKYGLIPGVGSNALLLNDTAFDKISYSVGVENAIEMFVGLYEIYFNITHSTDDRSNYYLSRRRLFYDVMAANDFKEWQNDGVYLLFDGDILKNKNEDEEFDSYTQDTIPSDKLNVCILKDKKDDSIISYSKYDIVNFWIHEKKIYTKSFYSKEYEDDIKKYDDKDYYIDYMNLNEFYEKYIKDFK